MHKEKKAAMRVGRDEHSRDGKCRGPRKSFSADLRSTVAATGEQGGEWWEMRSERQQCRE